MHEVRDRAASGRDVRERQVRHGLWSLLLRHVQVL